jgi:D-alanyl-D-alanine carboxypeptidase
MAALPRAPELVTITTPGGARFRVAKQYQDQFQGLVNDLEAGGYPLNPKTSGGFNSRYIAGTTTPSEHAFGRAIDANWDENPRGGRGKIPADLARAVATKYGMTWGGDWRNPDDMHFEVRQLTPGGALTKVGGALTKVAGANATPSGGPDFGGGSDAVPAYADTGDPQFKSGLAVPQAPPPDAPDPARQAALASLALQQTQSGPLGISGFNAPTSLSDAFAQTIKANQPPPQPPSTILGAPQYPNVVGPIPLTRRIG